MFVSTALDPVADAEVLAHFLGIRTSGSTHTGMMRLRRRYWRRRVYIAVYRVNDFKKNRPGALYAANKRY